MESELQNYAEEFDYDGIILRRADPDDTDQIINLQEIGKDDAYNRVYSYPRILKLIESAYLAISVLDRDGNVVAFAAFEDHPQGMRGMIDDRHYNHWEHWFHEAYKVTDLTALNTLWLAYFVAGGSISYKEQRHPFKKILQTVYTSMPEIIGVLFLASKYPSAEQAESISGSRPVLSAGGREQVLPTAFRFPAVSFLFYFLSDMT